MDLRIQRQPTTDGATLGVLLIDGRRECWTLEDALTDHKIPGQSCIPPGRYRVVITPSVRFGRLLPLLCEVPGFTGVRIHAGNTTADTAGCLLVGQTLATPTTLGHSRFALAGVQAKIAAALINDEPVWLAIVNPDTLSAETLSAETLRVDKPERLG